MRYLKRIFILLFCAILALVFYRDEIRSLLGSDIQDTEHLELIDKSKARIAYILNRSDWTVFNVNPGTTLVRVITNAGGRITENLPHDEEQFYGIEYEILDSHGKALIASFYHFRSRLTNISTGTGIKGHASFYLDHDLQPFDSRIMALNLSGMKDAAKIRLRFSSDSPVIEDVAVRVYTSQKQSRSNMRRAWKRMSRSLKDRQSRGNVYPIDLLKEEEKQNILLNLKQPLGPAGIENIDYTKRTLYVIKEEFTRVQEVVVLPYGLYIKKSFKGTVPLAGRGRVRLEFLDPGQDTLQEGDRILIRWLGERSHMRREETVHWKGSDTFYENTFDGGMLELIPSNDIVVRAFAVSEDAAVDITPDVEYLRTYLTREEGPLSFQVEHEGGSATPLRVDLRTLCSNADTCTAGAVKYEMLGAGRRVLSSGTLITGAEISLYDGVISMEEMHVSEARSYYFRVPVAAEEIVFSSNDAALVSLYNRPADFIREVRVPADFSPEGISLRLPSWFILKPAEYEKIYRESGSVLLSVQHRPPEDNEVLLSGNYEWEGFDPAGKWLSRRIVEPYEPGITVRPELYGALYRSLNSGIPVEFEVMGSAGMRTVSPSVIVLGSKAAPRRFRVEIDGQEVLKETVTAMRAEYSLPAIRPGIHRIMTEAGEGDKILINYASAGPDMHLLRTVYRTGSGNIEYDIEKKSAEEETLSFRYYTSGSGTAVVDLSIDSGKLQESGPVEHWSHLKRRFIVKSNDLKVPVLNSTEQVDGGQAFFVPFGGDLPAGIYRVSINITASQEGYIVASRILGGKSDFRTSVREMSMGGGLND
ncbi:hypothetical protein H8E50_04235 [bacterium]|nr:hypothetical protein [bacterium]